MRDGEASMTAQRVAAYRLSFTRESADYGHPDDDRLLHADVAGEVTVEPSMMTRYLQARTTFFDRVVVRSIDKGMPQIVAVGAGYDGRSLRYAKAGVRWFELDHPTTQADKRARLDRLGIDAGDIGFAAADFGVDDVAAALASIGHDEQCATLFTCEGVAGYLPNELVASLLAALRTRAAPNSRLAITLAVDAQTATAQQHRAALDRAVTSVGEPLTASLPRADLDRFFADAGWTVQRATDPAGMPIAESERASAFVIASADSA